MRSERCAKLASTARAHRELAVAASRHQSLSATVADLAVRGLAALGEPVELAIDPVSGLPVISLGRTVRAIEVADALDDE